MNFPHPIPESYWVQPGQFLAGEYPGNYEERKARQRISAFLEAGITDFIDLTRPNELAPYEPILKELSHAYNIEAAYTRVPIQDGGLPSPETMTHILNTIDDTLAAERKVYVHCWGGVGRTGTVVGCYLVRHGMTGEQALRQIAEWWRYVPKRIFHPDSPETDEQVEFIRNWQKNHHPGPVPKRERENK